MHCLYFPYLAVILGLQALALPSATDTIIARDDSLVSPTVTLDYATYRGSTNLNSNITSFLGVRYGAPPTGSLRFQAPQKPSVVTGTRNATALPAQCHQAGTGASLTNPLLPQVSKREADSVATSEDCLFLNVIVPNFGSASGLPVVVWIHGGGYVAGSGTPHTDLTVDSGNQAISVMIQYRLGVFGFLAGPEVKAKGALNAGLLDQTFALEWVQTYISKFGGDPTKVTIWGESAGAGSVLQHIVANGGQTDPPLFRAAITSSPCLPPQYPGDAPIPTTIYNDAVNGAGCANATDTFKCLTAVNATALGTVGADMVTAGFYGTFTFGPVVDGSFIVERPTITLQSGKHNGDVLLAVTNTFEGSIFVDTNPSVSNTTLYAQEVFPTLDASQMAAVAAQYAAYNETLPTVEAQAIAIMGEATFICPAYYLLQAFNGTAWKGEFAIPHGSHAEDVAYYFTSDGPSFNNSAFIASFSSAFLDVVLSLNPNNHTNPASITPAWAQWSLGGVHTEMLFNKTVSGEPEVHTVESDAGVLARCAFWASIAAQTAQ